jgi:hypothetical protein
LNEEVGQERGCVEIVFPINSARVVAVEPGLHDDRPDVHTQVQDNNQNETNLGPSSLAQSLHVEDETEAEASDDAEEWRDER